MVRPSSRNCGLYTAKIAKAAETLSGFSTWKEIVQETLVYRPGSIPTIKGTNPEPEGAAASKGLDSNLSLSV